MSTKDERIIKWWNEGCTVERIAAKLGNPNDTIRVMEALARGFNDNLLKRPIPIKQEKE